MKILSKIKARLFLFGTQRLCFIGLLVLAILALNIRVAPAQILRPEYDPNYKEASDDDLYNVGAYMEEQVSKSPGKYPTLEQTLADGKESHKKFIEAMKTPSCASQSCIPFCYLKENLAFETTKTTLMGGTAVDNKECAFCGLFTVFYNAASKVAKNSINAFSKPMVHVVVVGFAIWIALQIIAFVSSPEVRDLKDLISTLINQSFIVIVVVGLLNSGAINFFNDFLSPVYLTGQKIAQTVLKPSDLKAMDNVDAADIELIEKINATPAVCKGKSNIVGAEGGALPKAMGDSILCTMSLIQNRVASIKALGSTGLCMSWKERKLIIIPHLNYLFVGFGLWIGAMVMILGVPLMMVDSIFQMAIAAAMLPFAIASYAFKITRKYSKVVWETFLNSMFGFIFISLIALMLVTAYQSIIVDAMGGVDNTKGLIELLTAKSEQAIMTNLLQKLPWFSVPFIKIVFVCLLSWAVLGTARNFAGEFSGSISSTSIGSSIGTMAGSAAKSLAVGATKKTFEAAAEDGWKATKGAFGATVGAIRTIKRDVRANRFMKKGTQNADGSYSYTRKNGTKFVVTQNANGSFNVQKIKEGKSKLSTEDFTIVEKTDKNGAKSVDVRFNNSNAKNMFRNDGKLVTEGGKTKYEALMEKFEKERQAAINSGDNAAKERAEKTMMALSQVAAEQRMPHAKSSKISPKFVKQTPRFDKETGKYIGYDQENADGSVTKIRIALSGQDSDGRKRMLTEVINIDKNGKGESLKSNGMINAKTSFSTTDGTANGDIDADSQKTQYGLSSHHESYRSNYGKNYVEKELRKGGTFGFNGSKEELDKVVNVSRNGGSDIHEFGTFR